MFRRRIGATRTGIIANGAIARWFGIIIAGIAGIT
jgi:hypothetical protein